MEKIEVGYREFLPGIHHQYLLYTNSLGIQYAASGWPETRLSGGSVGTGKIVTTYGIYDDNYKDHPENPNSANQKQYFEKIASGADLSGKWAEIVQAVTDIGTAGYNYNMIKQNSNTVVGDALSRVGLPEPHKDTLGPGNWLSPGSQYGCGINSDSDSIIDISHINNMKVGDLVKLSDISQGDWDIVCVLMPYSGGFSDSEDERINRIDQKISELNLSISEGDWHFLFEKEGIVVANSFKTRNKLDIKQKGFDAIVQKLLNIYSFTPRYCTEFSQAIIFKFKEHDWNYIILGEIQE